MKVGIHNGQGKVGTWALSWIKACKEMDIPHIVLNCYSSNIIKEIKENGVTHLMWPFSLRFQKDQMMAKSVLFSAEKMGIRVFPNFNTNWHFEDKIAQKYLIECVDGPIVPSWAFYEYEDALSWLQNEAKFPLVAKLRKGAGSSNVKLISNFSEAKKYAKKMFGKGVNPMPTYAIDSKNRIRNVMSRDVLPSILKKISYAPVKYYNSLKNRSTFIVEKGYVYFQKFMPDNAYDLRIAIVGEKAWGFHRAVRKNDFRASGSGVIDYDIEIPVDVIKRSFELANKLCTQSISFDYVHDNNGNYFIVEMSYGYVSKAIFNSKGYWDPDLNFHSCHLYPELVILEDFINNRL
jgi:hypothetical protein